MSRMFLVRHGESIGDESSDPGLSEAGRSQVSALTQRLAHEGIEAIWHGPRRRARETAQLLAGELATGAWSTELLEDRTPVPSAAFRGEYSERRLEWFDSVPEQERDEDGVVLSAAWAELRARARGLTVVLVTHSFVIAHFVALTMDAGPGKWMSLAASNAGLTIIEANARGDLTVRAFNETGHLRS